MDGIMKIQMEEYSKCVMKCNNQLDEINKFLFETISYFKSIVDIVTKLKGKSDKNLLISSKKEFNKNTTAFFTKLTKLIKKTAPNPKVYKECIKSKCGHHPNIKEFAIVYYCITCLFQNKAFLEALKAYKDILVNKEMVKMFEELYYEL